MQPPAYPVALGSGAQPALHWGDALPSVALAGLVVAIAIVVPLAIFFLWMLAGGVLAVALYRRRRPGERISPGMGARLGAWSGLIGSGIFAVVEALDMLVTGGGRLRQQLLDALSQAASHNPDPNLQELILRMKTPEGLAVLITIGMGAILALFVILSSLGGTIGAALLRDRRLP